METFDHGRSKISLLFAEDDPCSVELVSSMITAKYPDMELHTAENGKVGFELFKEQRHDIVLTDINMPVMDGIQMAKEIRALSPNAVIVAITAHSDTQYLLDAFKSGISRYLLKPIDHKPLFEAIEECVARINLERRVKKQNEVIRKLSYAVEQSPSSVIITDTSGSIEYVNSKFTELTGYTQEEAIGQNPRILKTTATPSDTHKDLWMTINAGLEWRGEFLNQKKNGEIYWETASIFPICNEKGIITNFIGVKEDITERKRLENELRLANTELEKRVADRTEELNKHKAELEKQNFELLKTKQELELSRNHYSNLYDFAPLGYVTLDDKGVIDSINLTGASLLGVERLSLIGSPFLLYVSKKDTQSFYKHLRLLKQTKEPVMTELSIKTRGDGLIQVQLYSVPVQDFDRAGTFYRTAITDITELKRTEEALRKSEERYSLAVDGASDGIWDRDLTTGKMYFSPRWKSMLGYEDHEISNNAEEWEKRIHPDDYRMAMETREAYLAGEISTYEVEFRLQHKNLSYLWILARGACLRDSQGNPYRMAGSHTDITSRKIAEKSLLESEKKYRTLFETSKDTIFVSDTTGRVLDINQAGVELLGYTKKDLLSLDMAKIYYNPEDRKLFWQKLLSSGFVKDYEVDMKRKDDEKITVHLFASEMKDDEGNIAGYRVIVQDVTERKKLQQQLLHVQKMESIGMLAGGIAHDFNNLLNVIYGYGQILQESIPANDQFLQDSVGQILKASGRAAELTRSLLAFSRKQVINPKPVYIDTIISNTSKLIQRIIGADIEFRTDFYFKELLVKADAGQLEQMLMNLATNACDSMPNGGNLLISTKQVVVKDGSERLYDLPVPGKYAVITVADTGSGICKESLKRLFEPFYTTKEVGKGTGLGLSIVYGITKQHDGSVLVSSEPGKGSTFNVYLPIIDSGDIKEESKKTVHHTGGTETLLVAEDEEMVKVFLKKILEKAGYRVIVAGDGEEALARFKENDDISLVLSDVVMPKKNGKEILREIKKLKPWIKVIFISGYTADIIQKKGTIEEGIEFVTKPFTKNDILLKIREVLDRD